MGDESSIAGNNSSSDSSASTSINGGVIVISGSTTSSNSTIDTQGSGSGNSSNGAASAENSNSSTGSGSRVLTIPSASASSSSASPSPPTVTTSAGSSLLAAATDQLMGSIVVATAVAAVAANAIHVAAARGAAVAVETAVTVDSSSNSGEGTGTDSNSGSTTITAPVVVVETSGSNSNSSSSGGISVVEVSREGATAVKGGAAVAGSTKDKLFDLTVEMMVNDFDDERTMEEEEALAACESEDPNAELSSLQKESDMPLEELLALYGYRGENQENESPDDDDDDDDEQPIERLEEQENEPDAPPQPSKLRVLYEPITEVDPSRLLRCKSDISRISEEEDEDYDYSPDEDEWRKTIMVGSDFQAAIPDGLNHYEATKPPDAGDQLLWDPSTVASDRIEDYIRSANKATANPFIPLGCHLRDNEKALFILQQSSHDFDEAMRRVLAGVISPIALGANGKTVSGCANTRLQSNAETARGTTESKNDSAQHLLNNDHQVATIGEVTAPVTANVPTNGMSDDCSDPMSSSPSGNQSVSTVASAGLTTSPTSDTTTNVANNSSGGSDQQTTTVNGVVTAGADSAEVVPEEELGFWTEEECRNFESGVRHFGKNFYQIQQNKVRTRSVGELVQFYYLWKKSERHDLFANKTRLAKKKFVLDPGITDFMDRYMDDGSDGTTRDRSSSPSSAVAINNNGSTTLLAASVTAANVADSATTTNGADDGVFNSATFGDQHHPIYEHLRPMANSADKRRMADEKAKRSRGNDADTSSPEASGTTTDVVAVKKRQRLCPPSSTGNNDASSPPIPTHTSDASTTTTDLATSSSSDTTQLVARSGSDSSSNTNVTTSNNSSSSATNALLPLGGGGSPISSSSNVVPTSPPLPPAAVQAETVPATLPTPTEGAATDSSAARMDVT